MQVNMKPQLSNYHYWAGITVILALITIYRLVSLAFNMSETGALHLIFTGMLTYISFLKYSLAKLYALYAELSEAIDEELLARLTKAIEQVNQVNKEKVREEL